MSRALAPLPAGLALLAFGAGIAAVTLLSLSADDVSYTRTEFTARLALLLAAPALVLYVLRGPPGPWWLSFWTAGLAAYWVHVWWAVVRTYQSDFAAIVAHQSWVAYTNAAVTLLWTLDVAVAWFLLPVRGTAAKALHVVTWAAVAVSFLAASAVFRSGAVVWFGYALGAALVIALATRLFAKE